MRDRAERETVPAPPSGREEGFSDVAIATGTFYVSPAPATRTGAGESSPA